MMFDWLAPYRMMAYAAAVALAALACFGAGWAVNGWRLGADVAQVHAEHDKAVSDAVARSLGQLKAAEADRDKLAAALASMDAQGSDKLRKVENENSRLRDCVRTGACVVRVVKGICADTGRADVPQAAAGRSVDTTAGSALTPDAESIVLGIRTGAGRFETKLAACQQALGCITGQGVCK